jgi:glycine cleavage system aminomethyltransferase T
MRVVSRLRSVNYAPTFDRTIGFAYLPADAQLGDAHDIEVFDRRLPASVAPDVLWDPDGAGMRG